MTEHRTTARSGMAIGGRVLVRALRVFLGAFGALEGRGNAVDPPPVPTPRSEEYRP